MNTYIEKSSTISISSTVSNNSVVGAKTLIDANCNVTQSCIGSGCKIGKNVQITNSIIDSNVIIEDDVYITNAIIQSDSILKSGCVISKGAILTQGVVVKQGVTIPEASICSLLTFDSQEEEFIESNEAHELFEKGVIAYVPRDMVLKQSELVGYKAYDNEEESDLDEGLEDSDADPIEDFKKDVHDVFETVLGNTQIDKKLSKQLIMETKSCKLTYNVQNPVIIECMWEIIFSTINKDLVSKDLLVEI